MSACYFDTSALAKLYIDEPGRRTTIGLFDESPSLFVLSLASVELRSAIRMAERTVKLARAMADLCLGNFDQMLAASVFQVEPVSQPVMDLARSLLDRHPLKAYDAMQLAGFVSVSIQVEDLVFVCSDRQLIQAALVE